jgi:hypothetical protein
MTTDDLACYRTNYANNAAATWCPPAGGAAVHALCDEVAKAWRERDEARADAEQAHQRVEVAERRAAFAIEDQQRHIDNAVRFQRERDEADEALAACRAVATGKIAQARDWLRESAADHRDSSRAEWCRERAARLAEALKAWPLDTTRRDSA